MLQHADIRTFTRHYEVDVDVDVQGIVRKTGTQTPLVRFACSLSASIDPDRPYKLSSPLKNLSLSMSSRRFVHGRRQSTNASGSGRIEKPSWNAPIWHIKPPLATWMKACFPSATVSCGKSWNISRIGRWKRSRGMTKPSVNYETRSSDSGTGGAGPPGESGAV